MEAARRAARYVLPSSRTLVALAAAAERKRIKEKMEKWKTTRPTHRRQCIAAAAEVQRTMPALGDAVDFGIDVDSDHPAIMAVRADAAVQDMIRRDLDRISDRLPLMRSTYPYPSGDGGRWGDSRASAAAAAAAKPMDLQILVPIPPIAAIPLGQAHPSPGIPIRPLDGPGLSPPVSAMCPQQPVPDTDHDAVCLMMPCPRSKEEGPSIAVKRKIIVGRWCLRWTCTTITLDRGHDDTTRVGFGDGRMISGFRRAVDGEQPSSRQKEPRKRGRAKTTVSILLLLKSSKLT